MPNQPQLNQLLAPLYAPPLFPFTLPILPFISLMQGLGASILPATNGILAGKFLPVTTPFSGAYGALATPGTTINAGQLFNKSPYFIGVCDNAQGNNNIPIPPGAGFNIGPLDLSNLFIGGQGTLNSLTAVVYVES